MLQILLHHISPSSPLTARDRDVFFAAQRPHCAAARLLATSLVAAATMAVAVAVAVATAYEVDEVGRGPEGLLGDAQPVGLELGDVDRGAGFRHRRTAELVKVAGAAVDLAVLGHHAPGERVACGPLRLDIADQRELVVGPVDSPPVGPDVRVDTRRRELRPPR